MDVLLYLIPTALVVGGIGLVGLLWAMKSGQFDDLDGAAHRILFPDDDKPGGIGRKSDGDKDSKIG